MSNKDKLSQTTLLSKEHKRSVFDCGVIELDEYLKKYALQNQKKKAARTYVVTQDNVVVGYYVLVYGGVLPADAPEILAKGMGKYPIPVIVLARLAVDVSQKGKGLGAALLKDALLRTIQASDIAGLRAMLVHAKDDAARAFYLKFGFLPSPTNEYHLFLPISEIEANYGEA